MYEAYWDLEQSPFGELCAPEFFFRSQSHQAGLLKIQYVVEHGHTAGLLVGGMGCGKTCVLNQLTQALPEAFGPVVHVVYPQLNAPELLRMIARELDATDPEPDCGLDLTLHRIEQRLRELHQQQRHPILIVDEAHLITDPGVFQALHLLLNFRSKPGIRLCLLLAGEQSLLGRMQRVPQLDDRIAVRSLLQPMSDTETADYVRHRLEVAGRSAPLFEDSALDTLYATSEGIPRRINRLCDMALLVGFADQLQSITAADIEAVSEEMTAALPD